MSRFTALADRLTGPALAALAGLNLLFLAAFATMLLALTSAQAQEARCIGRNLMGELGPDSLDRIAAATAATPNSDALFYTVEKAGRVSWLIGTMHVTDPRVTTLADAAQAAYDAASTVIVETVDILDEKKMAAAMFADPGLTTFTDATTLEDLLADDQEAAVKATLDKRGIPLALVRKMKPWMLTAMLAVPGCETARKQGGGEILDAALAKRALAEGKRLEGLEQGIDQIRAIASTPDEMHVGALVELSQMGDAVNDMFETMIALYLEGRPGAIMPMLREVAPSQSVDAPGYAEFEEILIVRRNRTMLEKGAPLLGEGGGFMAVGALHLPGAQGLVELLRSEGFTLTPVDLTRG